MNKKLAKLITAVRKVTAKCQKPGRRVFGREAPGRKWRARLERLLQVQSLEEGGGRASGASLGKRGTQSSWATGCFRGRMAW